MRRRLFAVMAAVLMVASLPGLASAQPGGNPFKCSDGTVGNYALWQGRDFQSGPPGNYIDGVQGETRVRDLKPCTNGNTGGSFVLPANLSMSDAVGIVQLGYGKNSGGSLRWVYTPQDNTGGAYDTVPGWAAPIVGHYYVLKIIPGYTLDQFQAPIWIYGMNDYTACPGPGGCWVYFRSNTIRHYDYGTLAWWAFETLNTADVLGTGPGGADLDGAYIRYGFFHSCDPAVQCPNVSTSQWPFGNGWTLLQGMTQAYRGPISCTPGCPNFPSAYLDTEFTFNFTNDSFRGYTANRNHP